ncbi:hypothetical protein K402DRAFT_464991 [Aulographum hederae CBS 113979]|uniref:Protamine P1 n=1 Tax=Aulographum hederae CBS 113979 TaxID=1176131 RepID=A0A6G1GUX1_9PEZI|nr:hypothetical protein K402DRAFT_464991 [Aulographum hederae CBS 113979]
MVRPTFIRSKSPRTRIAPTYESPTIPQSDILVEDSDSNLQPSQREAKRERIEHLAKRWLSSKRPVLLCTSLRHGPFGHPWKNPWATRIELPRKRREERRHKSRKTEKSDVRSDTVEPNQHSAPKRRHDDLKIPRDTVETPTRETKRVKRIQDEGTTSRRRDRRQESRNYTEGWLRRQEAHLRDAATPTSSQADGVGDMSTPSKAPRSPAQAWPTPKLGRSASTPSNLPRKRKHTLSDQQDPHPYFPTKDYPTTESLEVNLSRTSKQHISSRDRVDVNVATGSPAAQEDGKCGGQDASCSNEPGTHDIFGMSKPLTSTSEAVDGRESPETLQQDPSPEAPEDRIVDEPGNAPEKANFTRKARYMTFASPQVSLAQEHQNRQRGSNLREMDVTGKDDENASAINNDVPLAVKQSRDLRSGANLDTPATTRSPSKLQNSLNACDHQLSQGNNVQDAQESASKPSHSSTMAPPPNVHSAQSTEGIPDHQNSAAFQNSALDFSTQGAVLFAQQAFQNALSSPLKVDSPSNSIPGNTTAGLTSITPFRDFNISPGRRQRDIDLAAKKRRESGVEAISTQALFEAADDFTFSTVKKPAQGQRKARKRASFAPSPTKDPHLGKLGLVDSVPHTQSGEGKESFSIRMEDCSTPSFDGLSAPTPANGDESVSKPRSTSSASILKRNSSSETRSRDMSLIHQPDSSSTIPPAQGQNYEAFTSFDFMSLNKENSDSLKVPAFDDSKNNGFPATNDSSPAKGVSYQEAQGQSKSAFSQETDIDGTVRELDLFLHWDLGEEMRKSSGHLGSQGMICSQG